MKGINHIVTGVSTAVIVDTTLRAVSYETGFDIYNSICQFTEWQLVSETTSQTEQVLFTALVYLINVVLFVIGCLLPDMDQENSLFGRMLYVPVTHRTWTHTVWFITLFAIPAIFARCFIWTVYGCILHIFYDSLSKGGICWFYPISKYRKWTSGAQVKKNHKIYLYRTGEMSEAIFVTFIILAGVGMMTYGIMLTARYGGLPFHAESLFAVSQA